MYEQFSERQTEFGILNQAINAFSEETDLQLRAVELRTKKERKLFDAVLKIETQENHLAAYVKRWAQHANLGALIDRIQSLPMKGILVADYVNPKMAVKLREQQVQFIDTFGNAYLDVPPIYVFITGKHKLKQKGWLKERSNRAFHQSGLKVIFALLCRPELVSSPYRDIAEAAGVALGTVSWVINGLNEAGFIVKYGRSRSRRLTDYKRLLDRWVETYPEKLRPKLHIGNFHATDPHWWNDFDIQKFHGYWGGEIAATHYTQYLRPAVATIYIASEEKSRFLTHTRLRGVKDNVVDEVGTVKLYQVFWSDTVFPFTEIAEPELVPPVLAYADLISTADPRNREVARVIYDQYNARHNK